MTDKLRNEQMDLLIQAILSLKTPDDCYAFLEDVLSYEQMVNKEHILPDVKEEKVMRYIRLRNN